jgi:multidrug resistance protein, MATE family
VVQSRPTSGLRQHGRKIALLAWPILLGQLAVIANGVIDTAMTARFSSTDLAALAVGSSIYVSIFVSLNGVLHALSPVIGQLFGAKRFTEIGREVKQGAWLAALLSIIGSLILFSRSLFLPWQIPLPRSRRK